MNVRSVTANKRLLLLLGVAAAALLAVLVEPGFLALFIPLAVLYGAIRFVLGPLPRFIARIAVSIRWKILAAVAVLALVSVILAIINTQAMDYMHVELHDIRLLPTSDIRLAVNDLQDNQHGPFFSLFPFFSLLAALVALGLGVAIAFSVINPVRRMGEAMRRIASGDFSQPVQVENKDELGELANRINDTARDLARLQQATLAEQRAEALRERIAQVTAAQEEERRRISRELHDGLGPSLAALGNRLRVSRKMVRTDPQQTERELDEVAKSLKGHIQDIRHLIHDLRPLALDQLGLKGAVEQQVERFAQETGIEARATNSGEISLDPLAEVTVFRVVQECLSNIQKHANAARVEVSLQGTETGLAVRVQDDGQGFDADESVPRAIEEGFGLMGMHERAELVGGRLAIQSSPGGGCQVTLYVPLKEAEVGAYTNLSG